MNQLIRDVVAPQVEEAITASGIIDDYTYEISLDLMPVGESMAPTLSILLCVPDPSEIGRKASAMTFIPGPFPEAGHIGAAITGLIQGLVEKRAVDLVVP